MTRARLDGLYLVLIGSVVFALLGPVLQSASHVPLTDFRALYYPARTLLQDHDPYQTDEVQRLFQAEGGNSPEDTAETRQIATQAVYPPTSLAFAAPVAMLPWGLAHWLWTALTIGSLIFASLLIWNLGADYAPVLSGVLIGFLLANSEILIVTGNSAGIAISLCAVAVWCFMRVRYIAVGILCLAVSLAIKPHDAGLVWFYFLLAGGVFRKHALQTFAVTLAISLSAMVWVWLVAPHWMQELHFNLLAFSAHGGTNDPGVAAMGPKGVIDLQSVLSGFRNDPRFYNPLSYLICAPPLLLWGWVTLRSRSSQARSWLALAVISPLSLLPVYHRQYDAKLLLLMVPACALLWAGGGRLARLALLASTTVFVVTGDLFWIIVMALLRNLHQPATGVFEKTLLFLLAHSVPLLLLLVSVFYLWVYARSARQPVSLQDAGTVVSG